MNNGDRGATGLGEGERRIIVLFRFQLIVAVAGVAIGVVLICGLFWVTPAITDGRRLRLRRESGKRCDQSLELSLGLDLRFVWRALAVG